MEFDRVMGCGLGWFVSPKFLLCDGLGLVASVVWWVGLKKLDPRTTVMYLRLQCRHNNNSKHIYPIIRSKRLKIIDNTYHQTLLPAREINLKEVK